MKRISTGDYLNSFREDVRETIIEDLIKGKSVSRVMELPEGKVILDGPIEQQRADLMEIVTLAIGDRSDKQKAEAIIEIGRRVKVRTKFIGYINGVLNKYYAHRESMGEVPKTEE